MRRRVRPVGVAVIRDPSEQPATDSRGAVGSVYAADLTLPGAPPLWTPPYLQRLERAYWRYIARTTRGLVRVIYSPTGRALVLIGRRIVLLRLRAPEYLSAAGQGSIRWPIGDGLLVAAPGGYLGIEVRRMTATTARVEVAITAFRPALAPRIYSATQARIHMLVTHGFLRSLAQPPA